MHKISPIDVSEADRKKTAPGTVLSVSYEIKRKMNRYLTFLKMISDIIFKRHIENLYLILKISYSYNPYLCINFRNSKREYAIYE